MLMTLLRSVSALFVFAIVTVFPHPTAREGRPWRVVFEEQYAAGGYVVLDHALYSVGPKDLTEAIGYISRSTGLMHERYMFVRCTGLVGVRYLSPSVPAEHALLEQARFYGPTHMRHDHYERLYG